MKKRSIYGAVFVNAVNFLWIIKKQNSMKFLSILRDGAKMNDLFYASQLLRFDKEMEYRSVTGGLLSLAIIVAVLVGFASMIIDTLALNTINSVELTTKDSQPSPSKLTLGDASKFMMAVELWGVNMESPVRFFDVLMLQLSTSSAGRQFNHTLIPLSPCTREHWAAFPDIVVDFDRLAMNNWLCPPIGTTLELAGDYTSNIYQYVNISVNPCIQRLRPNQPCATPAQLARLFSAFEDAIRFKIYYTNPLINSGQKDYKSYYLQTSTYISFGASIGGEAYMHTGDYQISTDSSIWPYTSIQDDDGLLIEDKFEFHPFTTKIGSYATFFMIKSPTNHIYKRQVQKISTVLSFIGGLVSAISAALFVFKAYNTLAFELTVAISIFKPPGDGDVDKDQLSVNFGTFFKYYIYQFFETIGKPREWPAMKYLAECREEILKQLDVKALVKRIIFLEYCMNNLFEDYQLEGLQLQKPRHPSEIAKIREKMESLDTYQTHFFLDGPPQGNSQQKSQVSCQSSSNFSKNRESYGNLKGRFTIKRSKEEAIQLDRPSDSIHPEFDNKLSSAGRCTIQSRSNIIFHSKVYPIDPIIEGVPFANVQVLKEKPAPQGGKGPRSSKAEIRRSINLCFLKKNAEEGNPLSKKIWEQLEYYHAPNKQDKQGKFVG